MDCVCSLLVPLMYLPMSCQEPLYPPAAMHSIQISRCPDLQRKPKHSQEVENIFTKVSAVTNVQKKKVTKSKHKSNNRNSASFSLTIIYSDGV